MKEDIRKAKLELIIKCMAIAVCTKNHNWNHEQYEKGIVKPYTKVKKMFERIENEAAEPTNKQLRQALDMLISVFNTKKTPLDERKRRFDEIFFGTNLKYLLEMQGEKIEG